MPTKQCEHFDGYVAKNTPIGVLCIIENCPYNHKENEAVRVEWFYEPLPEQYHCKTNGLVQITEAIPTTLESRKILGKIIDKTV